MSELGHRINSVAPETLTSRYPSHIPDRDVRKARKMLSQGMSHADVASILGCDEKELISATAQKRGRNTKHGNACLNVKPGLRDVIRTRFRRPGEPMHETAQRLWDEHQQLCAWAEATGYPGFSAISPKPDPA